VYLIDANVLIEAKNRYYAFDIAPGFWDWIIGCHGAGRVFTIQKVYDEVVGTGDRLSTWVKTLPDSFRIQSDSGDQPHLATLAQWANARQYTQAAITDFLASADYFLIAQAARLGYTVVTHETPAPTSQKRVKIPDACGAVGVSSVSPFEVMRSEGARLTL
jgi:hypothetical protein